ncbi:uncharacterized protein LOC130893987 [Diorhabda carinulata]|nr:uncharacterized protein LOC130893987 [Diorhabda carinulata]
MSHVQRRCASREDMLRMQRLILEGLEVALHLCNTFLFYCGPNRIMDILSQILPTAYYTNVGYWPFYETENGHSLCVCGIFEIPCLHDFTSKTQINLRDISEPYYFKAQHVKITFTDLEIDIHYPKENNVILNDFEIVIKYKLKQFWTNEQFTDSRYVDTTFVNVLSCAFVEMKQTFKDFCIFIKPHPLSLPVYGYYFPTLTTISDSGKNYPKYYIVNRERCPNYTVKIIDYTTYNSDSYSNCNREEESNDIIIIDDDD